MLDVYNWILSPEIREHMRMNYPLSVGEKIQIICGGFRSNGDKKTALRALLAEAEPGEIRVRIQRLIRLYRLALEELYKTGSEHLFVLPTVRSLHTPKRTNLSIGDACLYASYRELLEHADDIRKGPNLGASNWERVNGKWDDRIEFDVQKVNGAYCSTRFWPSDKIAEKWGIDENTMDFQLGKDELGSEWVRYPIPFVTGDLVKLDAPMLEKPLFGVMDNALDLNGTRYMWMGYVDGDYLDAMVLSYNELDFSGYRVIDWLHPASPEELPEGEEILKEIGEYLSRQPRCNFAVSDADYEFHYFFGYQNNLLFRRRAVIPFSELLDQMRKEL